MRTSFLFSSIRDNHTRGKVADFLKEKITSGSVRSIVSAYFTIYAYEALADRLDQVGSLRFLFGEPRFVNLLDPNKTDSKSFKIEDEGISLRDRIPQKAIAKQCADWIEKKLKFVPFAKPIYCTASFITSTMVKVSMSFLAVPTLRKAVWVWRQPPISN
jgi:hypothetical protein